MPSKSFSLTMTDIQKLFDEMKTYSYPETMIAINGEIPGQAFFPGGKGTFLNDDNLSHREIMILGQDFDSEKNYKITVKAGREDIEKNPTWKNMLGFLKSLDISPNNCFFTNSILGIRRGESGTGKSPAFRSKAFIRDCQQFFLYQTEIQKPKIIFVLGKHVAEFLSDTSDDLKCWARVKNFASIDNSEKQIVTATFQNGVTSKLILLTHPSFRPSNIHRRKYLDYAGNKAEMEMVKSILQ